jgi:hypothetical protein
MTGLTPQQREAITSALIYHRVVERPSFVNSCACGWGTRPEHLGLSFAEHVVEVVEQTLAMEQLA